MRSINFAIVSYAMLISCAFCDPVAYANIFRFLDLPLDFREYPFEIVENKAVWNEGKNEKKLSEADVRALKGFSGEGTYILGAPAVILEYKALETDFKGDEIKGISVCSPLDDGVAVASSDKVASEGGFKTVIDIRLVKLNSLFKVVRFELKENIYNEHVSGSAQISPNVLAVTTSSSRHPFINTLYVVDVLNKKILGAIGFGRIRYLPAHRSFRIVRQVPNCENLQEILLHNELHPLVLSAENEKFSSPEWQSSLNNIIIVGE